MPLPKPLHLAIAAITLIAAPVAAQDLTATLRINGDVMVSSGGDFRDAVDGQPILPGQRIMVGEDASARVQFSQDCTRTYSDAGVYTVVPNPCDEDQRQRQSDQAAGQGSELAGGPNPLTSMGIILGTVVGFPILVDQLEDDPTSR